MRHTMIGTTLLLLVTSVWAGTSVTDDGGTPAMGDGPWTQKADMPTARYFPGSAVVDGKIYVIGGAPVRKGISAVVEEYDPATDTWATRTNMPTARQGVVAAAVNGIIYAITGWDGSNGVKCAPATEAYDPATDTWIKKADIPTARNGSAVAVVDGRIYVIGGQLDFEPFSAVEAYDPATDKWTKKADMPTARFNLAASVIDGRIYVSGGMTKQDEWYPCMPTMEVYDPVTDTWTQTSDIPRPRNGHSASVVDGKIYLIGGYDPEVVRLFEGGKIKSDELRERFETVDVYDPETDTWTKAARCPLATTWPAAGIVDGKIYSIGGRAADTIFSTVYEFDPGLSR